MKGKRQKNQKARSGRGAALRFSRSLTLPVLFLLFISRLSSFVFRLSPFASRFLFSSFCFLPFAFCLLISAHAADERPVVRVAAETVAQSDRLKLGDVAEVKAKD